ncbi:unnamed protein product [Durusdinium trenchii]|uniref:EF-hand domain-containing protein n=1 Tax=Durusdinium trenchii TaxID=1381693 RepID=A0ABP0HLD2_9DINO
MAKPIVPSGRRNSLREGREQRSEERAKKKKLPNGFALAVDGESPSYPQSHRQRYFNFLSAALILSNAFFMGSETAWITCSGDAEGIGWYITNVCFTQIFLVELLVRWFVEGRYFWVDLWNVFDASLVLFSLIDDFVLTFLVASDQSATVLLALRFARMLRFVRVLRLLRLFKGLWYLVEGIVASLSSLAWAWLLLIVMMYLPAIFVTQTFGRNDPPDATLTAAFGTLPQLGRSMYTLFKVMTMETWADLARYTGTIINGAEIFFVLYIFCTSGLSGNCVVAVIVQNTCVHAKERQEDMRSVQEKNDANAMVKILEVFQTADVQQTGQISKKEFLKAMDIPSVMQLMHEVQIDVRQAALLFDVLDYNNSGTLDSEEFLEGIMLARGEARSREVIAAQCDLWKAGGSRHNCLYSLPL